MDFSISSLWEKGIRNAKKLDERTHGWLGLLVSGLRQTFQPKSVITSAAIAYFALFSLFPIILLSIAIASFGFGSMNVQGLVVHRLEFFTPALGQLLGKNIEEIILARGPVTVAAIIGLAWSASSLFYMLSGSLNEIWVIKRKPPVWRRRSKAILFVLIFVVPILSLASFLDKMFGQLFTAIPEQIIPLWGSIRFILAILLDVALFLVVYLILPHGGSTWREILPGAIAAGLMWELAKVAFLFLVTTYLSISNLVYGSLAAMIAFLAWAYLTGLIFLFGAYLSAAYFQRKQKLQGVL